MLAFAQVSSTNTSRMAEILPCRCFHCLRRRATSARSCSLARRLFFKAETYVVEEMPHAVIADRDAAPDQLRQQFATGDVELLGQPGADPLRLIGQRERLLATHRQCPGTAGCRGPLGPADRRGVADLEAPCRFRTAHAASHRSDHAFA